MIITNRGILTPPGNALLDQKLVFKESFIIKMKIQLDFPGQLLPSSESPTLCFPANAYTVSLKDNKLCNTALMAHPHWN